MRVVVTGSSGKAGRFVVPDFVDHGYDVLAVDLVRPAEPVTASLLVDVTQFGQTAEALAGADAVVHLAAIPASGISTEEKTFRTNMLSTFNVFEAARVLGLKRVVWASSETILGLPFEREPPAYAPIDEEHPPLPQSSYATSKLLGEELARQTSRRSGIPIVGLRFSNIMDVEDYSLFPSYWDDPRLRSWNLWSYVDGRDVALTCRHALEAALEDADHFIIAAADTVMTRPSAELMREVFPGVPLTKDVRGTDTLLSIERAGHVLGFAPQHSWRHHLSAEAVPDR
jgi:nucleoside-diphosphate-sugar epimerase